MLDSQNSHIFTGIARKSAHLFLECTVVLIRFPAVVGSWLKNSIIFPRTAVECFSLTKVHLAWCCIFVRPSPEQLTYCAIFALLLQLNGHGMVFIDLSVIVQSVWSQRFALPIVEHQAWVWYFGLPVIVQWAWNGIHCPACYRSASLCWNTGPIFNTSTGLVRYICSTWHNLAGLVRHIDLRSIIQPVWHICPTCYSSASLAW
jgi:hypothetical protein